MIVNDEAKKQADRTCALGLIHRFFRLHYDDLKIMTDEGLRPLRELGIPETEISPRVLQRYFGGATNDWANFLYNGRRPTKVDMACLRASIELNDVYKIRQKSKMIRLMQRTAERGGAIGILGAKKPLQRRDGSIYRMDSFKMYYEALGKQLKMI
jgi:hypothetical protein